MLNLVNFNTYKPINNPKNSKAGILGYSTPLKYKYAYSNDILDIKHRNTIAFSAKKPSNKFQQAQAYLDSEKRRLEKRDMGIESLDDLDLDKLEGILDGIKVFEGVSIRDFKTIADTIEFTPLVTGCTNACSHCYANSRPFAKGKTGDISTVHWNDFINLVGGMGEIRRRLGFNPFKVSNSDLMSFYDSDSISIKSYDSKRKPHNIAEAVREMYDNVSIKLTTVTAGWDKDEDGGWPQQAAEELVETLKNPKYPARVMVSIHPFHKYMTKSIELEKSAKRGIKEPFLLDGSMSSGISPIEILGAGAKSEEKSQKSGKLRQKYIDRMTNVLKTFLPLFKLGKIGINLVYAPDYEMNAGYDRESARQLLTEILDNLEIKYKKESKEAKKEIDAIRDHLEEDQYNYKKLNSSDYLIIRQIDPIGRGKRFFTEEDIEAAENRNHANSKYFSVVDINGDIYQANAFTYELHKTGIQLNFRNKGKRSHMEQD